jgi:hypothetical protein
MPNSVEGKTPEGAGIECKLDCAARVRPSDIQQCVGALLNSHYPRLLRQGDTTAKCVINESICKNYQVFSSEMFVNIQNTAFTA